MRILKNKLDQHVWDTLLILKSLATRDGSVQATPWVQPEDVIRVSQAELKDQGVLDLVGKQSKVLSTLLSQKWIAISTLHRLALEGLLVTRERVTWGNLDRVVSDRYKENALGASTCREAFRLALTRADERDGGRNIADERIHIYHGHNLVHHINPECRCLEQEVLAPEGVRPAPVPGRGGRRRPAGRPVSAPPGSLPAPT